MFGFFLNHICDDVTAVTPAGLSKAENHKISLSNYVSPGRKQLFLPRNHLLKSTNQVKRMLSEEQQKRERH